MFYADFDGSFDAVYSLGNGKALIEVDQYEPFITSGKQNNPDDDHVIIIPHIDFSEESWHHVVGTWKNSNSTGNTGVLHLYFDGILVGEIMEFDHTLDWNIDDWEIRIGLKWSGYPFFPPNDLCAFANNRRTSFSFSKMGFFLTYQ